ncbi:hypothetical protein ACJQWK_04333 [Exserohilum turcicum]
MGYTASVAIPTLIGSLCSMVATACVLVCYVVYRHQQRSFRHALVLNLGLAEFINSVNNSISGIYAVANRHDLRPGTVCVVNGWVGQWSVQAADFSVLAIAIVTLLTITRKTYMPTVSTLKKVLICSSVWIMPTISASTVAGLHAISPVSGNWCWISADRTDLRYGLAHGLRFTIIFSCIFIYVYIWFYMRKHFSNLNIRTFTNSYDPRITSKHRKSRRSAPAPPKSNSQTELNEINVEYRFEVEHTHTHGNSTTKEDVEHSAVDWEKHQSYKSDISLPPSSYNMDSRASPAVDKEIEAGKASTGTQDTGFNLTGATQHSVCSQRSLDKEVNRMLLLNAYPILYIILWMPGIINRLVEASGHKSHVLTVLQSSTQFIGLTNAITYGFNEHLRKTVKGDITKWFRRG